MMKISTFFFVLGQGIRNTFKNKMFSLASVATISACLFLFGVGYSIIINLQYMVKTAEEGVSVTVFFNEDVTSERFAELGNLIRRHPAVKEAVAVTGEEAWEGFKEEYLGEYADGFPENPLEHSFNYQIYLNDVTKQGELVAYLENITDVRKVRRSDITADALSGVNSLITYVSVGIILILLGVSIFLISNTVIIGISNRKEEITIMKYIGASDAFVRTPFVIEGILIGAMGALIPLVIIFFLYNRLIDYVLNRFQILATVLNFLPVGTVFHYLLPISFAVGIGIGFLGSFVTVRRHLKV